MSNSVDCLHESFEAQVNIGRLSEVEGGPITGYKADITCKCVQCGVKMRFLGVPAGSDPDAPRVSIDGCELRAPMEPALHDKFQAIASYRMPSRTRQ